MKKVSLLLLFLFASGVSAAAAQDVQYNFDQSADFSKFKTYKWVSIKNAAQIDGLTAKQITQTIDGELAKKGLTKTDADSADLYIGYQTAIEESVEGHREIVEELPSEKEVGRRALKQIVD
jgi:Domain of unknown function (DUF4136)